MKTTLPKSSFHTLFGKEGAALFLRGVDLFNKGKHWEAHEVFEDLWRSHEGEVKTLAQGFVQLAAAFSYIEKKRCESILYLFDKSAEKLAATSRLLPQANILQLVTAAAAAKEEIERLGEEGLGRFNPVLYPRIDLILRPPQVKSRKKRKSK